jgi:uncharacterized OB-fold protein
MASGDTSRRPLPDITERMRPFYDAAREQTLAVQRCEECGNVLFPARDGCPNCFSDKLEWLECSGGGEIFSFVVVHHVYHAAFADRTPYVVAEIKLDEGVRMRANVIGAEVGEVRIGMRVLAAFENFGEDIWMPIFQLAQRKHLVTER